MQTHPASFGITIYNGRQFPAEYRGNIFAAQHGSWKRGKGTGYKIIRAIVKDGALLISEDASGTIWRVTSTGKAAPAR